MGRSPLQMGGRHIPLVNLPLYVRDAPIRKQCATMSGWMLAVLEAQALLPRVQNTDTEVLSEIIKNQKATTC